MNDCLKYLMLAAVFGYGYCARHYYMAIALIILCYIVELFISCGRPNCFYVTAMIFLIPSLIVFDIRDNESEAKSVKWNPYMRNNKLPKLLNIALLMLFTFAFIVRIIVAIVR